MCPYRPKRCRSKHAPSMRGAAARFAPSRGAQGQRHGAPKPLCRKASSTPRATPFYLALLVKSGSHAKPRHIKTRRTVAANGGAWQPNALPPQHPQWQRKRGAMRPLCLPSQDASGVYYHADARQRLSLRLQVVLTRPPSIFPKKTLSHCQTTKAECIDRSMHRERSVQSDCRSGCNQRRRIPLFGPSSNCRAGLEYQQPHSRTARQLTELRARYSWLADREF